MGISKVCEITGDIRPEISKVFVDGFYQWLTFFSKDKEKLARAFAHIFDPGAFYVSIIGGEVAGMAACTDGIAPSVRLCKQEFTKHLGLLRGNIAAIALKREFEDKKYPFDIPADMGMIEFVATSEKHRGKGVATDIIRHIHETTPFLQYALEAADTNTAAVKLYEKLGYREFKRVKGPNSKRSGVDFLIYMKYRKCPAEGNK